MTGIDSDRPIAGPGAPGWADGWPDEPKVTHPELLLFGEFAGPVRLLGQAVHAAADAYALICKRALESGATRDYEIERAYAACLEVRRVHFELAIRAMQHVQQVSDEVRDVPGSAGQNWVQTAGFSAGVMSGG